MYEETITRGCPFVYDSDPARLRQCQKARGHKGDHQWNGVDGFYIKWAEKLLPADSEGTES